MRLVLISPEHHHPTEHGVLAELFRLGLERYHVRKPAFTIAEMRAWLEAVPAAWRSRLVLHQHHALVREYGLGGVHTKASEGSCPADAPAHDDACGSRGLLRTRSCHTASSLRESLGHYDAVFYSPVFPSISKPGYAPADPTHGEIMNALKQRTGASRCTEALALGGITVQSLPRALALGFDGVAVLGAVWQSEDPIGAFQRLHARVSPVDRMAV